MQIKILKTSTSGYSSLNFNINIKFIINPEVMYAFTNKTSVL